MYQPAGLAFALLVSTLLLGCSAATDWDQEYACTGQEESSAYFVQASPSTAIVKQYPLTIDFHLRSHNAYAKNHMMAIDIGTDAPMRFSGKSGAFWIHGEFNPETGALRLIDEKQLKVADQFQQIRTSGQYHCKKIGA